VHIGGEASVAQGRYRDEVHERRDARKQSGEFAGRLLGRNAGAKTADARQVKAAQVVTVDAHGHP